MDVHVHIYIVCKVFAHFLCNQWISINGSNSLRARINCVHCFQGKLRVSQEVELHSLRRHRISVTVTLHMLNQANKRKVCAGVLGDYSTS